MPAARGLDVAETLPPQPPGAGTGRPHTAPCSADLRQRRAAKENTVCRSGDPWQRLCGPDPRGRPSRSRSTRRQAGVPVLGCTVTGSLGSGPRNWGRLWGAAGTEPGPQPEQNPPAAGSLHPPASASSVRSRAGRGGTAAAPRWLWSGPGPRTGEQGPRSVGSACSGAPRALRRGHAGSSQSWVSLGEPGDLLLAPPSPSEQPGTRVRVHEVRGWRWRGRGRGPGGSCGLHGVVAWRACERLDHGKYGEEGGAGISHRVTEPRKVTVWPIVRWPQSRSAVREDIVETEAGAEAECMRGKSHWGNLSNYAESFN